MKTIHIPDELISSLKQILKHQKLSMELLASMPEEELLQMLAPQLENEKIKAMMKTKSFSELVQDMEIKELITNQKLDFLNLVKDCELLLEIIESY